MNINVLRFRQIKTRLTRFVVSATSRGFAALAILTRALGIGSATTIFSAIQNILLDPFPYTDTQRVVAIQTRPHLWRWRAC